MYPLFYLLTVLSVLMTCGKLADARPSANGSLSADRFHAANPPHAMDACDGDPFFKVTPENIKESGALEWFLEWDARVNRDSPEFQKAESYYDYILQTFISPALPASCNVNNCRELRCEDFKMARNMTKDRARQVYFISRSVQNIFSMTQAMHDQAEILSGILSMHTQDIAKTFIWKVNPADEKKCKLLSGLVKAAISSVFTAVGAIPGAGPEATLATRAGVQAIKLGADGSSSLSSFVGGQEIDQGICAAFPKPSPDLWPTIQGKMEEYVAGSVERLRTVLETTFNSIIMGNLTTNSTNKGIPGNGTYGRSILAEKISSNEYFILGPEYKDLLQVPEKLTEAMAKPYLEKAIATCLRLGQCSIHCTNETNHHKGTEKEMASSRFIPRPGIWCQYQCWRDSTKTKNIELFGLKALQAGTFAGITLDDLGKHAYDDWEENRYHAPTFTDFSVESFTSDVKSQAMSGDHLPVCFSDMAPRDFHYEHQNSDKVLPCFCGDIYGNETGAFLKAMHIEEWDGFKHKGLHNACDTSYEKDWTSPLSTFMGYCRIAQAGLAIDEGKQLQPDHRCDDFTKEVKDLTESQGNPISHTTFIMCESSALGRSLCRGEGQQDAAAGERYMRYTFCDACSAWYK